MVVMIIIVIIIIVVIMTMHDKKGLSMKRFFIFLSLIRSPLFHIQLRYHSTPYSVSLVNVLSLKQENKPPSVIFFRSLFPVYLRCLFFFLRVLRQSITRDKKRYFN